MIINKQDLLLLSPLFPMFDSKQVGNGVSFGLTEAGYDVRIAQEIQFFWNSGFPEIHIFDPVSQEKKVIHDTFTLASTIEMINMPNNLVGIVHDKSTWAREGVAVQNTVLEPGWKGGLTLELNFQRRKDVKIPFGSGIAQILFNEIKTPTAYNGKYQNQGKEPQEAIWEK